MRSVVVVSAVFLAAVVVVCLAAKKPEQLQNRDYSQLGGSLKKFVDLTIIRANQQLNFGHLNFEGIGQIARVTRSSGVVLDVRLRKTGCSKAGGTDGYKHRPECSFKRLQVRCMVCSSYGADRALRNENNYLMDCVRRQFEHKSFSLWNERCNPSRTGTTNIFSATEEEANPTRDLSNFIQNPSVPVIKALADIPEASVQTELPGLKVYQGSDFRIRCYVPARLPNSFFRLTLNDTETRDREDGATGHAEFLFPAADGPAHQGVYRCAYEVTTGRYGQTLTFRSEPLPLSVYYFDSDDYSVDLSVDE